MFSTPWPTAAMRTTTTTLDSPKWAMNKASTVVNHNVGNDGSQKESAK